METVKGVPVQAPVQSPWRVRLLASGIHFAASVAVLVVALYLIVVHWYPGFHFTVDGGWQGLRLIAAVDFVLGPVLTIVIFNPRKARNLIVFDLTCIAVIQIAALVWGFYAVHSQRPVSVNYFDGQFYSITAEPLKIEKADPGLLESLSDRSPALIYVRPTRNDDEDTRQAMQLMVGGLAEHEDPFFFERFDEHWRDVVSHTADPVARAKAHAPFAAALQDFLARHGGQAVDYRFFPYIGRYGECTLAFDAGGRPVDAVGCAPF